MIRKLLLLLSLTMACHAQTTISIGNTVAMPNAPTFGLNLDGPEYYAAQQIYRNFLEVLGGDFPSNTWRQVFPCASSGATTTSWPASVFTVTTGGWPVNYFAGATYRVYAQGTNTAFTGATTGTVTASTTGSATTNLVTFTVPTLSRACLTGDLLLVSRLGYDSTLPFANGAVGGGASFASAGSAFETTDLDPTADNTYQALTLPAAGTLSFIFDADIQDATSPTAPTATPKYVLLNGSYTLTYKIKCGTTTTGAFGYSVARQGVTTFLSGSDTCAYSATNGAGWTTFTHTFTASETTAAAQLTVDFTATPAMKVMQVRLTEAAVNKTPFRDAVINKLIQLHPGTLREMANPYGCMDFDDLIALVGDRRGCGGSGGTTQYTPQFNPVGIEDTMEAAYAIGAEPWITVSSLFTTTEWTNMVEYLCGSATGTTYGIKRASNQTAAGLPTTPWCSLFPHIYIEHGNEQWTSDSGTNLSPDNGLVYGRIGAQLIAAMKAAPDYNASVLRFVLDGWYSGAQYDSVFGFTEQALGATGCTLSDRSFCPDYVDTGTYMFINEGSAPGDVVLSGANVSATGEPFNSIFAEDVNVESTTATSGGNASNIKVGNALHLANYNVPSAFYETNFGGYTQSPTITTQLQEDQMIAGGGNAIATMLNLALAQRDAAVSGPLNIFSFAEPGNGVTCNGTGCTGSIVAPLWRTTKLMAAGTAQATTAGAFSIDTPLGLAMTQYNVAKGTNNNLMTVTQSGTPTLNYAGGQYTGQTCSGGTCTGGTASIIANTAVPQVNVVAYSNSAGGTCTGNWTVVAFNTNLTTAEPIVLDGPCIPLSSTSVTKTVFNPTLTAQNENSNLSNVGTTPAVVAATPSTSTGLTSDTLPAASMTTYTYTLGSPPPPSGSALGGAVRFAGGAVVH